MPTSNPLTILLAQDRWASRLLMTACAELSDAQFQQPFAMGPGSLHNIITHILAAMQGWSDFLAEREQRPRLDEDDMIRTPAEMLVLLDTIANDLANSAAAKPLDELTSGERGGRTYTFARGAVLTHVTTHGMHHRAQCLNLLRQLGVDPLPPAAVLEWMFLEDGSS